MKKKTFYSALAIATLTALSVRFFLIEDFRISSGSMSPSLLQGDLVFVNKAVYNLSLPFTGYVLYSFRRPKVGEVVVFGIPEKKSETFVKRVIANEGDSVEIRDGLLLVNGVSAQYTDPKASHSTPSDPMQWAEEVLPGVEDSHVVRRLSSGENNFGPVDVPKGHFFVLGDNRTDSIDSRKWGPIPYTYLKGKAGLVWMSLGQKNEIRRERIGTWVN